MIHVDALTIPGLLHDITFEVAPGDRLGIIGESGSGKSLTALSIMGLTNVPTEGSITVSGVEMVGTPDRVRRKVRGKVVGMVFQEPMTALDPLRKIGSLVSRELLAEVGVDRPEAYPHQLSGGQRQRVLIALALSQNPDYLICDEPTTALDVTVQRQILDLIDRLVEARGMGLIFISHDLAVVNHMTSRVLTFKDGRIVDSHSEYARALAAASHPGPPAAPTPLGEPIVSLSGVSLTRGHTQALDDVSLTVRRGERLGLVGGSGSGKTTLLHTIAGLLKPDTGTVDARGTMQMVFQDPYSSLDPRMRVIDSVAEAGVDTQRAQDVLAGVGLAGMGGRLPREFSGGQRQRISIARAAAPRPDILLADEPVSALDVTVRKQVLELIDDTVGDGTLIFCSHDLAVVRELCPRIAVMHRGRIVEHGDTEEIWRGPQHEYTRTLIQSRL
ncbi:ABC transporter ATP-binding protein [Corynebacterium sp. CNCTC7651]|uniref:ATP-binding cassette domain-containing protein n=1 Tax=Corynebacterium sp. CNCTC7651 TaxID=2815361 RepID=UPI001F26091A|nr:ABC transporter ATP-binding protein [Corynebacterium sp. CNCTC7651]UIZ91721.1 ABC transporter ATP-binding protein [Corynebacterium sp. CNCTC7651]